jgi:hypothetical protein
VACEHTAQCVDRGESPIERVGDGPLERSARPPGGDVEKGSRRRGDREPIHRRDVGVDQGGQAAQPDSWSGAAVSTAQADVNDPTGRARTRELSQ